MSRKVLVVDDEKLIVKGLRFSLEQDGMEVDCAYDGEEALEKAKAGEYDIILLDLMLPGIDGYQVCREIRARANTRENTRADARSGTVLRKKYAPPPEAQCGGSSGYPPVPPPSSRRASGKASNPTGRPYIPLHAFPQSSRSPSPPPPGKLRRNPETPSSPAIPPA